MSPRGGIAELMYFRPFPVLTLVAIPAVTALLWLGTWQAGRAEWKAGLIENYERASASIPESAETALCRLVEATPKQDDLYRPIDGVSIEKLLGGWPPRGEVIRMFGQDAAGNAGWRRLGLVTPPACIAGQGRMVIEGQFEPFIPGQPERVPVVGSVPARYMLAVWPAKPMFAADNSPETNDWHWFDTPGMAAAFGSSRINDRYYLAVMPETLPAHLSRTPPATHIGYSATWYGMAIAFVVIYAVFHARAGRLRFRRRDPAQ